MKHIQFHSKYSEISFVLNIFSELDELFCKKIRSDEQLLDEQSKYSQLFKKFENHEETDDDAVDWNVLFEDAENYDKKHESSCDEVWTDGAMKEFIDDSKDDHEPYISTVELMHLSPKKQKMEILKVVDNRPWLKKALIGYQKREEAAIKLNLDFFTFQETENTKEERKSDEIEVKENCVKFSTTKTKKSSSRKRLLSTFSASTNAPTSSALSQSISCPLGSSQLSNILNGRTLHLSEDLQKQLHAANVGQSMNINQSIQINFVLGKDSELLKEIQFDGKTIESHIQGIKDRVMSRLPALPGASVEVKKEPLETIDLIDDDESHTSEASTQTQDNIEDSQSDLQAQLQEDPDSSDGEDFLDDPKAPRWSKAGVSANLTSNLTLPFGAFKLNDTAETSTLAAAAPPKKPDYSHLTGAERLKILFGDDSDSD